MGGRSVCLKIHRPPLKGLKCRCWKYTDFGYGLGGLEAPGREESVCAPRQTFAAPLLRLEPMWEDSGLPLPWGFCSSQITNGLRPESPEPQVGLPHSCSPSPIQPLVLMDVQTLYRRFGTSRLAEIICLFWMSNFMFVAPFSCTERNCFCLLMEMFTFPRERHYSLGVMSAGAPHPLWEHKPVLEGGREEAAIGACTIATGAAICQCRGSQPASEQAAGRECLYSGACKHYAQPLP